MRAFVTGANGLIGSTLIRELLKDGHEITALVRKTSDTRSLDGLDIDRIVGDVRDPNSLRRGAHGCELMFHVAAVFSYWGYSKDEMYATAVEGAVNAVDAAMDAGVKRMILTSTSAIFGGTKDRHVLDELSRPDLSTYPDYFKSKAIQENEALRRAMDRGLDVIAVNPTVVLGPRDHKPSASLPGILGYITAPMPFTFDGGCNIVHAKDVARGHILLSNNGLPGERYCVGGENSSWPDIHRTLSVLCGLSPPKLKVPQASAWLAGAVMEIGAKLTGKPPLATRELSKQLGTYFWYKHDKAATLGYSSRPLFDTLIDTIAWLLDSHHLTDKQKKRLTPTPEVIARRDSMRDAA